MTVFTKNNWQFFIFYICTLLFYPLVWPRLFAGRLIYWSDLNLFTPGLIALLCCSLLLFNSKALFSFLSSRAAKLIIIPFAFILLIAFIQLIVSYNGQVSYLWTSLYWIAIPLFCAVNRREVEKYLPLFIIILGLATLIQTFQQMGLGALLTGLPGNWNWNASLIALFLPFSCFAVYKYWGKHRKSAISIIAALIIVVVLIIYRCHSKAVILGLIIASCSILVLFYWRKLSWINWIRAGILLAVLGIVSLSVFREIIFVVLKDDQRLFLWSGALDLLGQNLWIGCGPELFESAYAPHISAAYYLGRLVADRHPHAHNHLLQFVVTMGIPALIAWCSIIFYAVAKNLPKATGQGSWKLKLYLFSFILLFTNSMLDIVVLTWPLGCIFLILLGVLLGRAVERAPRHESKQRQVVTIIFGVLGICLAIILLNYLYFNLLSSTHYRNAKILIDKKDLKSAFAQTKISIAAKPTAQNTYLAAIMSFDDFKNPQECLKYLDMLNSIGFENYMHNNQLRAKALVVTAKEKESLLYFAKEQQNFPLSCVNLYYYRLVLEKLGRKQQAAVMGDHLRMILKMKGYTEKIIPAMLNNPDIDLSFKSLNIKAK